MTDQHKGGHTAGAEPDPNQVADQCRVVAHFAHLIGHVYADKARLAGADEAKTLHDMWLRQSADLIETFGNILNGMDAVTDEDEWTFPIVEKSGLFQSARATGDAS